MHFRFVRFAYALVFAMTCAALPCGVFAGGGTGQQGGQVTSTIDVQLTVLPLCKSVSVAGGAINLGSVVPSTQGITATFQVTYDCANNALPSIAFLSKNGCSLLADHPSNAGNSIPYTISGAWGNQLACSPGDLKNHFYPIKSSPTTYTLQTAPLLQIDPHVSGFGTFGDTIIATLDF